MKIKLWKKNIFITGALLSFFFLGGLSTARAECDPTSLTASGDIGIMEGVYLIGSQINSKDAYYQTPAGMFTYVISYNNSKYIITEDGEPSTFEKTTDFNNPIGLYESGENEMNISSTTCEPEENNNLVGGYFFKTPPASSLGAGVGTISTDVMAGLLPYVYVIGGLLIGFWLVEKIIALIPKDNTNEMADKAIERSEKDRKETKRIIATLD
jgi:hypothetical protein